MPHTSFSSHLPNITFYGDASSHGSQHMVAGGFAISGHRIREIEDAIGSMRERARITSQFHWSEYRGGDRRSAYEELIDYGFQLVWTKKAALHIITADFSQFNHKRVPGENKDASVNKMYWQLCLHRLGRLYGRKCAIHVRLDIGNDSKDICKMREPLCAAAYNQYGARPNSIRSIESLNSVRSGVLQMCDVFMGGIASQLNGNRRDTDKGLLAEHIRRKSGRQNWQGSTPKSESFLTLWHHQKIGPPNAWFARQARNTVGPADVFGEGAPCCNIRNMTSRRKNIVRVVLVMFQLAVGRMAPRVTHHAS